MSHSKPLIGVNADYRAARKDSPAFSYLCAGYYDALVKAGAVPVVIPPLEDEADVSRVLDALDGVVLVGGADLDPRIDGFMLHPAMRLLDRRREQFDRTLMRLIAERRMPVFGIGCGMQLLNVSQGGNLFLHIAEDLPRALPHADATDPTHRHALQVEPGTLMERVYGEGEIRVNSMHHMAIDEVAPGFAVTARCPDGVVEAIESTMDDWFALGTQFHPQSDSASALDLRIFEEFVSGITGRVAEMPHGGLMPPVSILPFDHSRPGDNRRWLAGVSVSSQGAEVTAAVVGVAGRGLDARAELAAAASADIPKETAALLRPALDASACSAALLAKARAQLAETEAALLGDLLANAGLTADRVLAVGLHDPGFWACVQAEVVGYLGWCDAARVAELTGLNVLDAFPARDLAQGGLGGPLLALPEWLLLGRRDCSRVLLDLGRTARLTYLPAQASDRAAARSSPSRSGPARRCWTCWPSGCRAGNTPSIPAAAWPPRDTGWTRSSSGGCWIPAYSALAAMASPRRPARAIPRPRPCKWPSRRTGRSATCCARPPISSPKRSPWPCGGRCRRTRPWTS